MSNKSPQKEQKPIKKVRYAAMMLLVEMEVKAFSEEEARAVLRHKMQTFAALNHDVAVSKMVKRDGVGFDLEPLP